MLNTYISYKCRTCHGEFVLLSEAAEKHKKLNKYLVCPYCSSKRVSKEEIADTVRECMQERSYRRVKGSIRQIRD